MISGDIVEWGIGQCQDIVEWDIVPLNVLKNSGKSLERVVQCTGEGTLLGEFFNRGLLGPREAKWMEWRQFW